MSDFYGDVNLVNGKILNLKIEKLDTDPTFNISDQGRIYFNTLYNCLRVNDGDQWITVEFSNNSSNPLVDSLGTNWLHDDLSFNPTPFNALDNISGLNSNSTLFDVIDQLDSAISNVGQPTFSELVDVTLSNLNSADVIIYNGTTFSNINLNTLAQSVLNFYSYNLKDVIINGAYSEGDIFVFDGNQQKYTNKKIYSEYINTSAATTFIVTHNMNVKHCSITPINLMTDTLITENYNIVYNSQNQFTITFSSPIAPKLLIWAFNINS